MPWNAGEQLLCRRAVDARGAWRGWGRQWQEPMDTRAAGRKAGDGRHGRGRPGGRREPGRGDAGAPERLGRHPSRGVLPPPGTTKAALRRPSVPLRGEILERETGFEPATSTLARLHSTTELLPPFRATRGAGRNRRSLVRRESYPFWRAVVNNSRLLSGIFRNAFPRCRSDYRPATPGVGASRRMLPRNRWGKMFSLRHQGTGVRPGLSGTARRGGRDRQPPGS